jgi:type IV pilus assembly protein PilW
MSAMPIAGNARRRLRRTTACRRRGQRGLTLVEMMVAMVVGLIMLASMSAVFVGSSQSRRELQVSAQVLENGRYALDLLNRELSQTGFYASLSKPAGATIAPCSVAVADWADSLAVHVVGFNNAEASPPCLVRKPGTDAIFVQRASTCAVGEAQCEAESAANGYLQVSECGPEYSTTPFVVAAGGAAASFALKTRDCAAATAAKRKLIRRIYFVGADDVLSYVEIGLGGASAAVPLVEDVEQLQFAYAFDGDADGTPDCFAATLGGCAGAQWDQVIGARIWVLSRSETPSRIADAATQFVMDDTVVSVAANSSGNLKRRVYSSYVPFVTVKSRREQ